MRFKLGLKVWSTNIELIPQIAEVYSRQSLDYVEIFCVPGTSSGTTKKWQSIKIPFVVHAPHSTTGLNFSIKDLEPKNMRLAKESFNLADALDANIVIFHPGTRGGLAETVRQAKLVWDSRMVFENKPLYGLDGSRCIGSTPREIEEICCLLNTSFCLDFGHAVAAANSYKIDPLEFVRQFCRQRPTMFHLTDGDIGGCLDRHDKYGDGSFPLASFLTYIPDDAFVTDEAKRSKMDSINEYIDDRNYLLKLGMA